MMFARMLLVLVVVMSAVLGSACQRDPRATALPFGTTDLSSVKANLDRLPKDEKDLVVAYVTRSRGDVMPANMADPDEPLTARTFAEAIKLQRDFLRKQAGDDAKAEARRADRDADLAPLRAAAEVTLVRREIVARQDLTGPREAYRGGAKQAIDTRQVAVTTYRLRNTASQGIDSVTGNVTVRKANRESNELGILNSCYIEHHEPLRTGESTEVHCANTNKSVSDADRRFIEMPESDFVIEWEPRSIRFNDGRTLTSGR